MSWVVCFTGVGFHVVMNEQRNVHVEFVLCWVPCKADGAFMAGM